MKLKFLYILGFALCLSTFASSNECIRHCPKTIAPSARPATNSQAEAAATVAQEEEMEIASPGSIIRLLYI
jgi:hypothetical protein